MPSFSTTIEDNSPVLVYSAGWATATGNSDSLISSYSNSNFMATEVNGATMTFNFIGTGVQIFGSKRDNHGAYQVTIDGNAFPPGNGNGNNEFQSLLFTTTNLKPGPHKLVLTNQEAKFVDVDFVSFQADVGKSDERLLVNVVQDTDPAFKYSTGWNTNLEQIGSFMGGTGHLSSAQDASFTYTFQGDGVSLYGPVGTTFGPYSVQVDGGQAASFTANRNQFRSQVLLYHATGLGPGQHTLKLNSQATQAGQGVAIDYATVYTAASLGGISSSATGGISAGMSAAAGAGIAVGIIAALLLFIGLFVFFYRRKRNQMRKRNNRQTFEKLESGAPMTQPEPVYLPAPRRNSSFGHMGPPSAYTYGGGVEPVSAGPAESIASSPTHSSRDHDYNYTSTESGSSSLRHANSRTHLMRASGTYSISSNSTSPRVTGATQMSAKGRRLHLPATAGQSFSDVSADELRANRMVVEGRPQDFGAIDPNSYTAGTSSEVIPPPTYGQATEPFAR